MGRSKLLQFSTLIMAFLLLNPKMECMPVQRPTIGPLCLSQISLVNHACATLPFHPGPPPEPPSPPDEQGGHGHRHGHGRRHRRGHGHHETAVETECCHWLNAMDDACVCELLVHLPPFLARPAHQYSITVDDECTVTYQCEGRLRI